MTQKLFYKSQLYIGMARATLVLDENVSELRPALEKVNFRVVTLGKGIPDEQIKHDLLSHRFLVTKNSKDFIEDAPVYDYGIISLEKLKFIDPSKESNNKTVRLISKAIIDYDIVAERTHFVLYLYPNRKHHLFKDLG